MTTRFKISARPLSWGIRIYGIGQSWEGKTPYVTVMTLTDIGMSDCMISLAHGVLGDEINVELLHAAKELKFRRMQFEVKEGSQATHFAERIETYDGWDRYRIDLNSLEVLEAIRAAEHLLEFETVFK